MSPIGGYASQLSGKYKTCWEIWFPSFWDICPLSRDTPPNFLGHISRVRGYGSQLSGIYVPCQGITSQLSAVASSSFGKPISEVMGICASKDLCFTICYFYSHMNYLVFRYIFLTLFFFTFATAEAVETPSAFIDSTSNTDFATCKQEEVSELVYEPFTSETELEDSSKRERHKALQAQKKLLAREKIDASIKPEDIDKYYRLRRKSVTVTSVGLAFEAVAIGFFTTGIVLSNRWGDSLPAVPFFFCGFLSAHIGIPMLAVGGWAWKRQSYKIRKAKEM